MDDSGYILFANPAASLLMERDLESLIGFPFSVPSASIERTEIDVMLPKGRTRKVEATVKLGSWFDKEAWIVTLHDIHERKLQEVRLRMASHVFASAHEAILITDPQGVILDVNASFTQLTGFALAEVQGKTPRVLKSGRHEKSFYKRLWHDLLSKGEWFGELWNRRKSGEVYLQRISITSVRDDLGQIQFFIGFTEDITEQREHEAHLEFIAQHDSLTRLPNRVLLADRLQQAMFHANRSGRCLALAYIDLDGFKEINDKLGHIAGDALLVGCAENMKKALRQDDTLSRVGGDEFVAVIVDLVETQDAIPLLNRLIEAASKAVVHEERHMRVTASLGVTFYPQEKMSEPFSSEQLIRQADQAMYKAKQEGKNRYYLLDLDSEYVLKDIHRRLEEIERGLREEEFVLHFQPKVELRTGRVFGFEALVRWNHPKHGLLMPGDFLPFIENHRLMIELGNWVLDSALKQIHLWFKQGLAFEVSVNVSARQLQSDFVQTLSAHLNNWPEVPPHLLTLEVLETSALDNLDHISAIIKQANALGVGSSLDDFGTGYSSLAYLKRLPIGQLKIDRLFVNEMTMHTDDFAIIEGVMGLASAFRLQVIAEGMESPEQGVMLLQLGCEFAQGFCIARPMPIDEIEHWLEKWHPDPAWSETPRLSKEKTTLLYACIEHKAWNHHLQSYLEGGEHLPPEPSIRCRFGQWLCEQPGYPFAEGEELRDLYEIHEQLHQVALQLILEKHRGECSAQLPTYFELSNDLQAKLRQMMGLFVST
ncbi:MAG: EAL domain-containing protein [Gammaproteobacteria bacterium]|nr:EAL domain-containing protein [Gammaproteobacteria bacterium]